jgi:hypothetical protein
MWWAAAARNKSNQTVNALFETLGQVKRREDEEELDKLRGQTDIFGNELLLGGGTKGAKQMGSCCVKVSASCDAILLVIIGVHVAGLITMIIATVVSGDY